MVAYRVVQEARTNAHTHGTEHRANVLIEIRADNLAITVTNPVPEPHDTQTERAAGNTSGLGLIGLRERVASVRGILHAGPTLGGWKTTANLPLTSEAPRSSTCSSSMTSPLRQRRTRS
jgi:signal transduction histidine kinase